MLGSVLPHSPLYPTPAQQKDENLFCKDSSDKDLPLSVSYTPTGSHNVHMVSISPAVPQLQSREAILEQYTVCVCVVSEYEE